VYEKPTGDERSIPMSDKHREKRRHERKPSNRLFRIYTSITRGAYTVHLKDISKGGAFIRTEHRPKVNETITFVVLDEYNKDRFVGNARVVWCKETGPEAGRGFGIELEKELMEEILEELHEK